MAIEELQRAKSTLVDHVRRSYQNELFEEPWRNLPEIPNQDEIMPRSRREPHVDPEPEEWDEYQQDIVYDPNLPHNIIDGPWPSKEEYISAHYQMVREDAIAGLRNAVARVKRCPGMMEDKDVCIYTHVTIKGILFSRFGAAFRVEFSNERAEKQIRWEQSKRLVPGTIVALTSYRDMFRKFCKIAIVAARPIKGGLDQNPPRIDLFWGSPDDAVYDPVDKYIMVEARSGYFEASRHMLVALQKLRTESFHLAEHLISMNNNVKAPAFIEDHPWLNLNSLVRPELKAEEQENGFSLNEELDNVNILRGFPDLAHTGMDHSQKQACKAMLTKRIAIIQGPPGTGKTFVSVSALKVMMDNLTPEDPPIIVSAQTNHAIDQLLTHIMAFEPNTVRLGGRSDRENIAIRQRTLYELRQNTDNAPKTGVKELGSARREFQRRVNEIKATMLSMTSGKILTSEDLLEHAIITQVQADSLCEEGWAGEDDQQQEDIEGWLTRDQMIQIPGAPLINQGLPMEESDIEFEQLQQLEQEVTAELQESAETEGLTGEWMPFRREWTGKHSTNSRNQKSRKLSARKNLYEIPKAERGGVYRFWEEQLNAKMLRDLRTHLRAYQDTADNFKVAKYLSNILLIKHLNIKIIGCTTTGLSKYRGLLAALQPRTLLIEEAAETLEATIIAGMFDSLQQLILVGDHQQLQAHSNVRALESAPYHMNVSMFERLINNHIGYVMLNRQRRMITDVRQLLTIDPKPFYTDLYDHESVWDREVNRPPIPGMGGKDTYFFNHNWPEARNSDTSVYNKDEAEMIAGFFLYLVLNGIEQSKITVLTFYNGQRKEILKQLKTAPGLDASTYFQVHTVDSYQGEENDVILLSVVRSNENRGIGFLDNRNRLVVALSRARRGLYIFGNSATLIADEGDADFLGRDLLWLPIIQHMGRQRRYYVDRGLPIHCEKHNRTRYILEAGDWHGNAGGCDIKCQGGLPCGHACPYYCHPFDHESVLCQQPCPRTFPVCAHRCSGLCGESCYCDTCKAGEPRTSINQSSHGNMALDDDVRNFARSISTAESDSRSPADECYSKHGGRSWSPPRRSKVTIPSDTIATLKSWQEWDATTDDMKLSEQYAKENAMKPTPDYSKLVFNETFRPVVVDKDGGRINDPKGREIRTVQRFDENLRGEAARTKSSAARAVTEKVAETNISESRKANISVWGTGPPIRSISVPQAPNSGDLCPPRDIFDLEDLYSANDEVIKPHSHSSPPKSPETQRGMTSF